MEGVCIQRKDGAGHWGHCYHAWKCMRKEGKGVRTQQTVAGSCSSHSALEGAGHVFGQRVVVSRGADL